ncbi:MAG TPA: hypothetical protein DC047_04590 [Blastocatellia bacterium]|nr:hypothetical protein [Blastocatellia bacterium]
MNAYDFRLMKTFASIRISYLSRALLMAGVLLNLCAAPAASFGRMPAQAQQEFESFAGVAGGVHSHALTTGPRAHSKVPASKQKRVRHSALDLTALPRERFQLSSLSLSQRALDNKEFVFGSSCSVRPQGRAPPASV